MSIKILATFDYLPKRDLGLSFHRNDVEPRAHVSSGILCVCACECVCLSRTKDNFCSMVSAVYLCGWGINCINYSTLSSENASFMWCERWTFRFFRFFFLFGFVYLCIVWTIFMWIECWLSFVFCFGVSFILVLLVLFSHVINNWNNNAQTRKPSNTYTHAHSYTDTRTDNNTYGWKMLHHLTPIAITSAS